MNPNDEIRRVILRYFYDRNAAGTSRTGKRGSAVKISDVKRELKTEHGLRQQQVQANLTYLVDNNWVKSFDVQKTVNVRGGTVPSITTFYEITAKGIDKIEGGSQFEPKERYAGINITATGSNIITLGDGNVVNAEFVELHSGLDELKEAITQSKGLSDSEKLEVAADIETIKSQLVKPHPDIEVVEHLWNRLERVANLPGVAEAYSRVSSCLGSLRDSDVLI